MCDVDLEMDDQIELRSALPSKALTGKGTFEKAMFFHVMLRLVQKRGLKMMRMYTLACETISPGPTLETRAIQAVLLNDCVFQCI